MLAPSYRNCSSTFLNPDIVVPIESSGNEFHNLITRHVITYFLLFTLSLLSKFHRLHMVFAFWEIKIITSSTFSQILRDLTNFYSIPTTTFVPDWILLVYLFLSYRSQFTSVITSVMLLSTLLYYIPFLRGSDQACTWYSRHGEIVDFHSWSSGFCSPFFA